MNPIFALAFTLTACGPVPDNLRLVGLPRAQDEALKPYVHEVEMYAAFSGVAIPEKRLSYSLHNSPIEDSMPKAVGVCYTSKGKDVYIKISIQYWDNATELEKRALMYHEMGHCVFDLGHDDKDITSIMYPYVHDNYYLEIMFEHMIEKMMTKLREEER